MPGLAGVSAGRIGKECCFAGNHGRGAHKANGAGIAADPTLTSAWAAFLFGLAASRFGERLAPDVSPLDPANRTAWFCHRRSHRHPVPPGFVAGPKARVVARASPRPDNPVWPAISPRASTEVVALGSMADRNVRPAAACFRVLLNRPTCVRSKPSATGPRRPRGQFPLPLPDRGSASISGR